MKFVPPLEVLLFAATMLSVWLLDTKRRHLLLFALGFAGFATGFLVLQSPLIGTISLSSPIASTCHFLGMVLLCEGVMQRMGERYSRPAIVIMGLCLFGPMVYFVATGATYRQVAPTINLVLGSLVFVLCVQARALMHRSLIERIFFIALVLLAVQLYGQALLSLGLSRDIVRPADFARSGFWQVVQIFGALGGAIIGLLVLAVTTSDLMRELQDERDTDPLTGVLNRRGLERHVKARRGDCGVIIADIDHFKSINDELGHTAGDRVLVEFARILQAADARICCVGRVGGEEFVLVVEGDAADCERMGNLLCRRVALHGFSVLPGGRHVTSSFGIAMMRGGETLWETVARADIALMRVKRRGRNRVAVEGLEFPSAMRGTYLQTA